MDQNNRFNATIVRSPRQVFRSFPVYVTLVFSLTFVPLGGCGKNSSPESPTGDASKSEQSVQGADGDRNGSVDVAGSSASEAGTSASPSAKMEGASAKMGGGIQLPNESEIQKMRETPQPGDQQPRYQLPDNLDIKPIEPPPLSSTTSSQSVVGVASWEEIRSIASAPGKVTVLDLWSLSCEPCMREFPQLVKMHQTMGDKVRCVAVNLDFDGRRSRPPESYQTKVTAFLQSVQAGDLESYLCKTPNDEVYSEAKIPSLPAVLVFDQNGKWLQSFVDAGETSGFHYETDVFPLVEKLASVPRLGVK